MRLGIERSCSACDRKFCYCESCWHNQEYCSKTCRQLEQKQNHRDSNQKYSKTDKGRKNNRERQKRHRDREESETSVTDEYSTKVEIDVEGFNREIKGTHLCKKCGRNIEHFVQELNCELGYSESRRQKSKRNYFSFARYG